MWRSGIPGNEKSMNQPHWFGCPLHGRALQQANSGSWTRKSGGEVEKSGDRKAALATAVGQHLTESPTMNVSGVFM